MFMEEPQLILGVGQWGGEPRSVLGSNGVRRHSRPDRAWDQPGLGLEFYSAPCQERPCGASPYALTPPTPLEMETPECLCHMVRKATLWQAGSLQSHKSRAALPQHPQVPRMAPGAK